MGASEPLGTGDQGYTDTLNRTGELRYWYTGPVRPGTGVIQISIQNPSSIGLDRYNDRYDRDTSPVRPGTGHWKKIELVDNLTCFQI
jgi:hypothetical protein